MRARGRSFILWAMADFDANSFASSTALEPRQAEVFLFLYGHLGATVSLEQILQHLYAKFERPNPKNVAIFIHYIRKKLPEHLKITTVTRRGYRMEIID